MEYQKIIIFLDNTPNQPSKCGTKNWIEINNDSHGTYNTNSKIKSKTLMLMSSLCGNVIKLTILNTVAAAVLNSAIHLRIV